MLKHILLCCAVSLSSLLSAADVEPEVGAWGALQAIRIDGQRFAVKTAMNVASPQWKKVAATEKWTVREAKLSREGASRIATGRIPFADSWVDYRQTFTPEGNGVRIRFEATPQAAAAAEAIHVTLSVPISDFAGGQAAVMGASDGPNKPNATLPEQKPAARHFLSGRAATGVHLQKGARKLEVRFDRQRDVTFQDDREYNNQQYSFYSPIHSGNLVPGQTVSAEMLIAVESPLDNEPVVLQVDASKPATPFQGFGGNFVYGAASPASRYNLDHLNVAVARAWMPLHEWEPQNDNADPAATDMQRLAANDKPTTNLRASLEIARDLSQRQIPYTVSVWPVPGWMTSPKPAGDTSDRQIVPRENWDELAESIGAYLLYAREKYDAQPDMFSFNEPDYGVRVKLTPEEHRDLVTHLGRHFEKLGLKTKLLGADVAHARGSAKFLDPIAASPEALRYIDAIAFHSWGGATPEQYGEWHQAALKTGKPLFVAEAGVDAQAWRFRGMLGEYYYAVEEARQYVELLNYARPQGILLWEYTTDYGIVDVDTSKTPAAVTPTKRFHFMRQFASPTPRNGMILQAKSSRPDVLLAALTSKEDKLTLHIVNDGPARKAELQGTKGSFEMYVTDRSRNMQRVGEVSSSAELPSWSFVTLVEKDCVFCVESRSTHNGRETCRLDPAQWHGIW